MTTLTNLADARDGRFPGEQRRHFRGLFLVEHVSAEIGFRVGYTQLSRPLISGRKQAPDPSGNGVLGQWRLMHLAELLQTRLLVLDTQQARRPEMVRHVIAEDFQRTLDTRTSSYCGSSRAPQIGVIEVGQPVRRGPHLAAHPALLPHQQRFMCTELGEQRRNGIAIANDHSINVAYLARLRGDSESPRRADQRERSLWTRARHFKCHRAAGLGQRAVRSMALEVTCPGPEAALALVGGSPRAGRPCESIRPVWRASASPSLITRT